MKTYPLMKNGTLHAFEVDNIYIGTMTIAKIISKNLGVTKTKLRKLFDNKNENHLEFEFDNGHFVVWEPFGDSSRYWIGPKDSRQTLPQIAQIEALLQQHRPFFLRKFFGDLITLNFKELFRSIFLVAAVTSLSVFHGLAAKAEVPLVDAPQLYEMNSIR